MFFCICQTTLMPTTAKQIQLHGYAEPNKAVPPVNVKWQQTNFADLFVFLGEKNYKYKACVNTDKAIKTWFHKQPLRSVERKKAEQKQNCDV